MADVTRGPRPGTGRDRGQLILVTGLLVAVTMVSLVLLLNTAIFTENLASRGTDQSGREAIEYRGTLVDAIGELVQEENARELGSWSTLHDTTRDGVLRIDNYTARNHATRGVIVAVNRSSLTLHEGKLVRQNDSGRAFTNASGGKNDWTLATGIEDTRNFSVSVNPGSLASTTGDAFHLRLVDGDGDEWEVYLYRTSPSEVTVATGTGGGPTDICSNTGSEVAVDLTNGSIGAEACPGYRWARGLDGDYDIAYRNGENVTGTYNLTVNVTGVGPSVSTTNLNESATNAVSPYHAPAVYSVTFDVYYESPTLTYRAPVRVAPGEPP